MSWLRQGAGAAWASSLRQPRSWELRTQKLKSHLMRTQSLKVLPLKPGVSRSQHRKKSGEVLEKNAVERIGRIEIRKKSPEISVSCMAIY